MNGDKMALLDTLDTHLLDVLQRFDVLTNLAGDIATAIHVAFVQYIQKGLIDFDFSPEQR
jgi:hypothetical protein